MTVGRTQRGTLGASLDAAHAEWSLPQLAARLPGGFTGPARSDDLDPAIQSALKANGFETTAWPPRAICRIRELVAAAGAHGSEPMRSAELKKLRAGPGNALKQPGRRRCRQASKRKRRN